MSLKINKNRNMTNHASSSGVGFTSLLAVLFIGLKLTGYITWSWWWVLSPLWIAPALILSALFVAAIGYVILSMFSKKGR